MVTMVTIDTIVTIGNNIRDFLFKVSQLKIFLFKIVKLLFYYYYNRNVIVDILHNKYNIL